MRERGRFHDTRLEPAIRALFPHAPKQGRDQGAVDRQAREIAARLAQAALMIEAAEPLPFGLGDCGFPISFVWLDALASALSLDLPQPAELAAYRERIGQVPAVAAELASYAPLVEAWIAARIGAAP